MKLLTHNMLACHIKGVKENQPFIIEVCDGSIPSPCSRPDAPHAEQNVYRLLTARWPPVTNLAAPLCP